MVRDRSIPVPFVQEVGSQSLLDGKAIGMKGEIKTHTFSSSKFFFALATGPTIYGTNRSDMAIFVQYREKEGWVVNQLVNEVWQTEERFPIGDGVEPGKEVYVRIAPFDTYFEIYANGEKVGERNYNAATPLNSIKYVYVDEDIELHRIQFEDNYYMVPFFYDFPSFATGKTLFVSGKPNEDASQFGINFQKDDDNIVFEFNPRFDDQEIVRNSKIDGDWGTEEKDGAFAFTKGEAFELIFDTSEDGWTVYVNGSKYCTYANRMPVSDVKQLTIVGDVELNSIH